MTEIALWPITNSGIWIPMLAPTCSTMISSDEPWCRRFNQSRIQFPLSNSMLLARDSIVGIPIPCSISLPASLFTRSVTHHPMINSLVTLCTLRWCPTEWAQRYLSVNRSDKSQSRFVPTQQTLSEIPVVHLYIDTQLRCDVWHTQSIPTVSGSCTISWSKEMILDIRKALAYELHDLCARLRIGSCPSHHSPNDVIPLSTTSNVHGQETVTIYWPTS